MLFGEPLEIAKGKFTGSIDVDNITGDREYTLPDESGKLALLSQVPLQMYIPKRIMTSGGSFAVDINSVNSFITITATNNIAVTLPANLNIGSEVEFLQMGDGRVQFNGDAGVQLIKQGTTETTGHWTLGKYSYVGAKKISVDAWFLAGDLVW